MLISPSLIFVHQPRTGGTSVRKLLMELFPYKYLPVSDPLLKREQIVWMMHQGLVTAHQYAINNNLHPETIPTLVFIRNPYSYMLSEYMYLSQKWGHKIKDLPKDFEGYLKNMNDKVNSKTRDKWLQSHYGRLQDYLCINGVIPKNLTIGRFETIEQDLKNFLSTQFKIDTSKISLGHENASEHEGIKKYYSEKEEQLVYNLWGNVFESGLYSRYQGLE